MSYFIHQGNLINMLTCCNLVHSKNKKLFVFTFALLHFYFALSNYLAKFYFHIDIIYFNTCSVSNTFLQFDTVLPQPSRNTLSKFTKSTYLYILQSRSRIFSTSSFEEKLRPHIHPCYEKNTLAFHKLRHQLYFVHN